MQIERAERAAIHLFIAGVGVAMMGVAGPLAFPEAPKVFWQIIVFAGGILTALSAGFMIYEYRDLLRRGRMIPILGMMVSGVLFVAFAGWHFWPHGESPAPPPIFSWVWEPLSASEIEKVALQLKGKESGPLTMAFDPRTAGKLA